MLHATLGFLEKIHKIQSSKRICHLCGKTLYNFNKSSYGYSKNENELYHDNCYKNFYGLVAGTDLFINVMYTENIKESHFKITTYYILALKQGNSLWIIKKRFNEFYDLHYQIKQQYPSSTLTFEASKELLNTKAVIENRKAQFLNYLIKVLNDKDLSNLKCVKDFIKPT